MTAFLVLVLITGLLAYANGSNDISKGIATLVGSGVSNLPAAVAWGTVWTVAGGLAAAFASQRLVATFSGKGFLASPIEGSSFLAAVSVGAVAWVLFASRVGLPVSTTHAIAGALAGAGIAAQGVTALHWGFLASKVALPLAVSPLVSVALLYAVLPLLTPVLSRAGRYCICLQAGATIQLTGALALVQVAGSPLVAEQEKCASLPAVTRRLNVADGLHWLSAALTSFARGLNDTPKIVALGIAASALFGVSGPLFYAAVALSMGAGSLVSGHRVTETLAHRVTRMSPTEGFSANLVTTLLVGLASLHSLPVSTTHVSSGAIVGLGLHHGAGSVRWRTVQEILLAWLVTLPVAAGAAWVVYEMLG